MIKRSLGLFVVLLCAVVGGIGIGRIDYASAQGTPISGLPPAPSPIPSDIVPATMTRNGIAATYALSLGQIQAMVFGGAVVLPSKGQATCTMAASTNCTATATIVAGGTCAAAYDAATTATLATLLPLTVSVSSATLSIKGQVSGANVSTAFTFDYVCE
jgi:hypothetical protein